LGGANEATLRTQISSIFTFICIFSIQGLLPIIDSAFYCRRFNHYPFPSSTMKKIILHQQVHFYFLQFVFLLFSFGLLRPSAAQAESKNEGEGGTDAISRLAPFTVNLASFDRYLQVMVSLQMASPEVAEKVKQYMPKVRHHIIVLLSSKESNEVESTQGKHDLIENIKHRLNQALELKEHDGITDIYLENFIIQ
jgi:flagellar FliL protein